MHSKLNNISRQEKQHTIIVELDTLDRSQSTQELREQLDSYREQGFNIRLTTAYPVLPQIDVNHDKLQRPSGWSYEEIKAIGCSASEVRSCVPIETTGSILLDDKIVTLDEFIAQPFQSLLSEVEQPSSDEPKR